MSERLRFVICWPWDLAGGYAFDGEHPIGADCTYCKQQVAKPRTFAERRACCLYCGMARGMVELIEVPPEECEDECLFHLPWAERPQPAFKARP